jgi:hypothetical protein
MRIRFAAPFPVHACFRAESTLIRLGGMHMNRIAVRRDSWMVAVAVLVLGLLVPAAAGAAVSKPEARTLGASGRTPTAATLSGTVNPNGTATTYFFQFGTTSLYGTNTGSSRATVRAS